MSKLQELIIQEINKLSIRQNGVHIVANWEGGGSDAIDFDYQTPEEFLKEFPEANADDVKLYYEGKKDGFVVRTWKDDDNNNEIVKDSVYYTGIGYKEDEDGNKSLYYEDMELDEYVDISFTGQPFKEIMPRIESQIKHMPPKELDKFLVGCANVLSGLNIGEKEAWKLFANIESLGIKAKEKHEKRQKETQEARDKLIKENVMTSEGNLTDEARQALIDAGYLNPNGSLA